MRDQSLASLDTFFQSRFNNHIHYLAVEGSKPRWSDLPWSARPKTYQFITTIKFNACDVIASVCPFAISCTLKRN